jgi:hypothetical protein
MGVKTVSRLQDLAAGFPELRSLWRGKGMSTDPAQLPLISLLGLVISMGAYRDGIRHVFR